MVDQDFGARRTVAPALPMLQVVEDAPSDDQ